MTHLVKLGAYYDSHAASIILNKGLFALKGRYTNEHIWSAFSYVCLAQHESGNTLWTKEAIHAQKLHTQFLLKLNNCDGCIYAWRPKDYPTITGVDFTTDRDLHDIMILDHSNIPFVTFSKDYKTDIKRIREQLEQYNVSSHPDTKVYKVSNEELNKLFDYRTIEQLK